MVKRLVFLELLLLGGLSAVFPLPRHPRMIPPSITSSLPQYVGSWYGIEQAISSGERDILGPDTQFARKVYRNGPGDEISVSIVFSGPDMNTSIHQPERCLPAQGWTVIDSSTVPIATPAGKLKVTRLYNMRSLKGNDGQALTQRSLDYYWFVGHWRTTPSHLERNWMDVQDRILRGQNQQWAYISVSTLITKDFQIFGRTEVEADQLLRGFIAELVPAVNKNSIAAPGSS